MKACKQKVDDIEQMTLSSVMTVISRNFTHFCRFWASFVKVVENRPILSGKIYRKIYFSAVSDLWRYFQTNRETVR